MDLIITILHAVAKDLPISPRFTLYVIAMQVQRSYNFSTNGWILLSLVPTLPVTKEKTQILLFGKNRTHDFRTMTTSRCAGYLLED